MLSKEAAKKIGIDACADKLGRDFILAHKNYAISIYGESADSVYCFVGVDDQHRPQNNFDTFVIGATGAEGHTPQNGECRLPG